MTSPRRTNLKNRYSGERRLIHERGSRSATGCGRQGRKKGMRPWLSAARPARIGRAGGHVPWPGKSGGPTWSARKPEVFQSRILKPRCPILLMKNTSWSRWREASWSAKKPLTILSQLDHRDNNSFETGLPGKSATSPLTHYLLCAKPSRPAEPRFF